MYLCNVNDNVKFEDSLYSAVEITRKNCTNCNNSLLSHVLVSSIMWNCPVTESVLRNLHAVITFKQNIKFK